MPDKVSALFDRLRHDPKHHLGLGDIRLTFGQQNEISDEVTALEQRVKGLEEVLMRAEVDVRVNLNPMLERLGMHPFTLMETDLREALAEDES